MKILSILVLTTALLSCNKIQWYKQKKKILLTEEFDSNDKGWKFGFVKSSGDTLQIDTEDISRIQDGILHVKSEGLSEEVFAELDVSDLHLDEYEKIVVSIDFDKPWKFADEVWNGTMTGRTEHFRLDLGANSMASSSFAPKETFIKGAAQIRWNTKKDFLVVRTPEETVRNTYFYRVQFPNKGDRDVLKFSISRQYDGLGSFAMGEIRIKKVEIYYQ